MILLFLLIDLHLLLIINLKFLNYMKNFKGSVLKIVIISVLTLIFSCSLDNNSKIGQEGGGLIRGNGVR
ncbi:hypothetical protein DM10_05545 [Borreliella garinii]|nr:hypothetical protein DM10_05545 [Borreliella garinii]